MSSHKKFAGRGMYEFYMPTTGKGNKNRRDRKNVLITTQPQNIVML